jgi:hypothetical protein
MTDEPLKVVTIHDKLDNIADVVNKIPPQTFKQKLYMFLYGAMTGALIISLTVAFILYRPFKKSYTIYYNTFYIQEKGGVRPAVLYTNNQVISTAEIDYVESKVFTRFNTGKTTGVMWQGISVPVTSPLPVKE